MFRKTDTKIPRAYGLIAVGSTKKKKKIADTATGSRCRVIVVAVFGFPCTPSTCAPLMPQVSFGKQAKQQVVQILFVEPGNALPPARLSSRIEWPALPSSLRRESVDGQILNFSPSCVPITRQREGERYHLYSPRL